MLQENPPHTWVSARLPRRRYGSATEVAIAVHRILSVRPAPSAAAARRLARLHRRLWVEAGGSPPLRAPADDGDVASPGATWVGSRFYVQVEGQWEDVLGFRLFETRDPARGEGAGERRAAAAEEALEGEEEVEGREWYSAKELVPKGGLPWDKQAVAYLGAPCRLCKYALIDRVYQGILP